MITRGRSRRLEKGNFVGIAMLTFYSPSERGRRIHKDLKEKEIAIASKGIAWQAWRQCYLAPPEPFSHLTLDSSYSLIIILLLWSVPYPDYFVRFALSCQRG